MPLFRTFPIAKLGFRIGIASGLLLVFSNLEASLLQFKPQSPIRISIQPSASVQSPQTVDLVISTESAIDVDNLQIQILLPTGVTLQKGNLTWQGALNRDENKVIQVTLAVPNSGLHTITAKATLGDEISGQFAAISTYNTGVQIVNKSVAKPRIKFALRDGLGVVEYQIP